MIHLIKMIASSLGLSLLISSSPSNHLLAATNYPWCVAHRGSSSDRLENSFAAFDRAYTLGAQAIEFDVRHTRDGQAIVMHDSTLARTSTGKENRKCQINKAIKSLRAKEIFENCILNNNEEIPSLRELFDRFSASEISLVLELKDHPSKSTLDLIQEFSKTKTNRAETLFIISFSTKSLRAVKHATKLVGTSTPLLKIQTLGRAIPWQFNGLGSRRFKTGLIHAIKKHGKILNAWTIDDPKKTYQFFARGIDLLTTNEVESCLNVRKSFLHET